MGTVLRITRGSTSEYMGTVAILNNTMQVSVNDPYIAEILASVESNGFVVTITRFVKSAPTHIIDEGRKTSIANPKFADALAGVLYDQGYSTEKSGA